MQAVRATWTSASFLLYAGGLVIAVAISALLATLGTHYGDGAFAGWSLLVFIVFWSVALAARAADRTLTAGLFAVSAVVASAVLAGAVEEWFGWLAHTHSPFGGFHVSHFLIELVLVFAALAALRALHFPLLVLIVSAASWFFVTDVLSSGGDWSATVTLVVGLALMFIGVGVDRVYGFWVQVVAGLTVGGALLWFSHSSDTDWILIALASLLYVAIASGLGRSSYAVLAAIGLLLATTHFVDKWFAAVPFPLVFLLGFTGGSGGASHPWAAALSYAVYGLVLMLLGLWLARRRGVAQPA